MDFNLGATQFLDSYLGVEQKVVTKSLRLISRTSVKGCDNSTVMKVAPV